MNHYELLKVNQYSSLEDVKSSYRKLAKIYHPDISKSDGTIFKQLTISYNWLLENHQPLERPIIKDVQGYDKLFRTFPKYGEMSYNIFIPCDLDKNNRLLNGVVINCIMELYEFRIILDNGTKITKTITISNVGPIPFNVTIYKDLGKVDISKII